MAEGTNCSWNLVPGTNAKQLVRIAVEEGTNCSWNLQLVPCTSDKRKTDRVRIAVEEYVPTTGHLRLKLGWYLLPETNQEQCN